MAGAGLSTHRPGDLSAGEVAGSVEAGQGESGPDFRRCPGAAGLMEGGGGAGPGWD